MTQRAHTRHELAQVLAKKGIDADAAEEVLDRMGEVGLIDDRAFADGWVESRQQRRHLSRRALGQELRRKGVDSELVDSALEQVDASDEYDAALALAHKKLRAMAKLEPHVRRRRLAGALARRGFGAAVVGDVLRAVDAGGDAEAPDWP